MSLVIQIKRKLLKPGHANDKAVSHMKNFCFIFPTMI